MEVFINGAYCSSSEARISVLDRGFLFGDGIFTTIKVEESNPLFLDRHLVRLQASCGFLHIEYPDLEFSEIISQLAIKNQLTDARVKIAISRGVDSENRIVNYTSNEATVAVLIYPLTSSSFSPVSLTVADEVRGTEPIYHHKTTSYLQNLRSKTVARERGFDDCIILDWRQFVCETSTANLFFIKGNTILTPPADLPLLTGIMRQALLAQKSLSRYTIKEDYLRKKALGDIEGAFITSAVVEVCPVRKIDGRPLPIGVPQALRDQWIQLRREAYPGVVSRQS
jgi:branched-chain amino acid aminotransferase